MAIIYKFWNLFVKTAYRIIGRRLWKTPGTFKVIGGNVFLDPIDGLSAWKRRLNAWEPLVFHKLDHYIDPTEYILEFGSCFGDTGLRLLSRAPQGKLLGIEPFPRYYRMLVKTLAANPQYAGRLSFVNVAYSRKVDHMDFSEEVNPYGDLAKLNNFNYGQRVVKTQSYRPAIRVPAMSLKTILQSYKFQPSMIFMDIEGAEAEVIDELLNSNLRPKLAWEHHAYCYGFDKLKQILARLRQAGYSVKYLDPDHLICLPANQA